MMEKIKVALLVLLMMGAFIACSDDDTPAPAPVVPDVEVEEPETNEPTAEELAQMAAVDKFSAANSVIRALAEIDSLPDNWENLTFEAQVGFPVDEANPDIRNVIVSSVEGAENYFLSIVPDLGLEGHAWSHEGIGTLTFRAVNEADCYAVLDVNLVHMPGLKQLRFVPKEVVGDNAFYGVPYYHAGDIVVDKDDVYWICIRPAGGPEGKGKAYFATFDMSKFSKAFEVNQDIYYYNDKGKIDKNKKYDNSGYWYYVKNLLEERMALSAAHTFAMIKLGKEHNFEPQEDALNAVGFDVYYFDTEKDLNTFGCNIAYDGYVSNKYTKVRQEKYLQPFIKVRYNPIKEEGYEFVQVVEKVVIDSKAKSNPYLLSLTTDFNPSAFDLLFEGKTELKGYPNACYSFHHFVWRYNKTAGLRPLTDKVYLNGYLDEKVLLMAQTSVKDTGKPHKDFTLVTTSRGEDNPEFWETLAKTQRLLYDQKNNGKIIKDITK